MEITVSIGMTANEKFVVQVSSVDEEVPSYSNARRYQSKTYAFDKIADVNTFVGEVFTKDADLAF